MTGVGVDRQRHVPVGVPGPGGDVVDGDALVEQSGDHGVPEVVQPDALEAEAGAPAAPAAAHLVRGHRLGRVGPPGEHVVVVGEGDAERSGEGAPASVLPVEDGDRVRVEVDGAGPVGLRGGLHEHPAGLVEDDGTADREAPIVEVPPLQAGELGPAEPGDGLEVDESGVVDVVVDGGGHGLAELGGVGDDDRAAADRGGGSARSAGFQASQPQRTASSRASWSIVWTL